ncbi:hypothetical protein A2U01_0075823, partial [Trifolium medium]|nr:hypothetical protein [Trifolium medium]
QIQVRQEGPTALKPYPSSDGSDGETLVNLVPQGTNHGTKTMNKCL